jgi:hypothetical protein
VKADDAAHIIQRHFFADANEARTPQGQLLPAQRDVLALICTYERAVGTLIKNVKLATSELDHRVLARSKLGLTQKITLHPPTDHEGTMIVRLDLGFLILVKKGIGTGPASLPVPQ